ncbi:MAG: AAA family ATPase [Flavobacteriales bacterium]
MEQESSITGKQTGNVDIKSLNEKVEKESEFVKQINLEMNKSIIGQKFMIERLLIGLLSNGHILLEGVPGLAKTLAINSLAKTVKVDFNRIQFTPDLLPADLIGTMIYNQKKGEFSIKKGPIFSNFILADEVNRAPAKVQSSLLEAMQEKQVTIGEETFELPKPFLVLATQNPIEQEGTYPLPEAQVDRFMLKVSLDYPERGEEQKIMRQNTGTSAPEELNAVLTPEDVLKYRKTVREVYMDEKIEQYIVNIVYASRYPSKNNLKELANMISFGGSPRASIFMALAAKAYAFINRRGYVIPEDVREICHDILRHRIGLSYEAEAENISVDHVINELLNKVEVP